MTLSTIRYFACALRLPLRAVTVTYGSDALRVPLTVRTPVSLMEPFCALYVTAADSSAAIKFASTAFGVTASFAPVRTGWPS